MLPLPVDGEAVHREAQPVERGRKGADVLRPRVELGGAPPEFLRGAVGPEAGRQHPEGVDRECEQALQPEAGAVEECTDAIAGGARGRREHGRLARERRGVRLRAPDGEVDHAGEHDRVPDLALREVVDPQAGRLEDRRAAHGLRLRTLPDRGRGVRPARGKPTRARPPPPGGGGERARGRELVAEDRAGPSLVPRRVRRSPARTSRTSASSTGEGAPASALRAAMAHARCLDCVLPRAPAAASAKKLARCVGAAGRNGVPTRSA